MNPTYIDAKDITKDDVTQAVQMICSDLEHAFGTATDAVEGSQKNFIAASALIPIHLMNLAQYYSVLIHWNSVASHAEVIDLETANMICMEQFIDILKRSMECRREKEGNT